MFGDIPLFLLMSLEAGVSKFFASEYAARCWVAEKVKKKMTISSFSTNLQTVFCLYSLAGL